MDLIILVTFKQTKNANSFTFRIAIQQQQQLKF